MSGHISLGVDPTFNSELQPPIRFAITDSISGFKIMNGMPSITTIYTLGYSSNADMELINCTVSGLKEPLHRAAHELSDELTSNFTSARSEGSGFSELSFVALKRKSDELSLE